MKVSKPVLILCIVLLLVTGYVHFFTGKKKPPQGPVPAGASKSEQQAATSGQGQPAQGAAPAPSGQPVQTAQPPGTQGAAKPGDAPSPAPLAKPQFDKLDLIWASNPFALPVVNKDKKKESGSAIRLSAILDRGGNRVAIIDKDVVKKGDFIGNERVAEIGADRVILIRGNARRTLILADPDTFSVEKYSAPQKTGETVPPKGTELPQLKPGEKPIPERAK